MGKRETVPEPGTKAPSISRRDLVVGAGATCALLGLGAVHLFGDKSLLRPPGAQDEARLLALCIRCGKCMEICPERIIRPAHIEDGVLNMRTPTLNFMEGWCTWCGDSDDNPQPLCAKTCPTGAISISAFAEPATTILGKAILDRDHCLAYRNTGCRFCYDACPYDAVVIDENKRPSVIADLCNGCGACEAACVSLKNASVGDIIDRCAIYIVPMAEYEATR
ncbi:MAG: 4Fe-4S dicluster domain-containing protein [Eggerthellaceae bacterium]|nr:4Fe-4S dicluster domain-containing protein [Eggerthellaceae bacterium]